jgi:SAM-dependent methyltransferase
VEQPGARGEQVRTFDSQAATERWRRGAAARELWLGPATDRMLDLAGVVAGIRVLDVAAGTGEQTLAAARRAGPTGTVLATDISGAMLEAASTMARELGLANVEARTADAQDLRIEPELFDAAICRLGLMFIPDVTRGLAEIWRALKPGAKFAAVVWASAEKNPYIDASSAILRQRRTEAGLSTRPSVAHVLGEPEMLGNVLTSAGFRSVEVYPVPHTRRFASASDARRTVLEEFPGIGASATDLTEADREAAWEEIETVFARFSGSSGVEIPGELLVGVGTKEAAS